MIPTIHSEEFDLSFKVYYDLMAKRVSEILLVSSPYDAFIMEEDGPLAERIIHEYQGLNLTRPPKLTWVATAYEAFEALSVKKFDLVITMPRMDDMDPYLFGKEVKQKFGNPPVFLLTHSTGNILSDPKYSDKTAIDKIFVWSGNTYLLLALIKDIEDRMNVSFDTERARVRVILLVEDSPVYCSSLLPFLYKEIVTQTRTVMEESLNEEDRIVRMRARPKLLVAETFEEAEELFRRFKPYLLSIFSDARFPRDGELSENAGFSLLSMIKEECPDMPLLMLSSEETNREAASKIPAVFVNKNSFTLHRDIHSFFDVYLGFGDFVFCLPDGAEVGRASNIRAMENILPSIPDESVSYHASRNDFSTWLMARSEIHLASKLRTIKASDFRDAKEIRNFLITCIRERRRGRQRGVVAGFSRGNFDPDADFYKIGKGSLGGKARGLAFISTLLRQNKIQKKFPEIIFGVPKTLVISTEGFDKVMSKNNLRELIMCEYSDNRISEIFLKSEFPGCLIRSLNLFLSHISFPLAVRSSSLLEDALFQSRAGIYKTCMLPNNHPDAAVRRAALINAVKLVYASTFHEKARKFAKSTASRTEEEKMAVIVQQVTGRQYGDWFYPAMAGVAQSYNFYPIADMKPEDGIVHLALGLGKTVVEGGAALRFCPVYPQMLPHFSKVEDILNNSQRFFYALRTDNFPSDLCRMDDATLAKLEIDEARDHFPVQSLCSTYIPEDNRIRDSAQGSGHLVATFANILKYKSFPLPEIISEILEIGRKGMGSPVEIEFAANLACGKAQKAEFSLLQIRPMAMSRQQKDVEITEEEIKCALCFSNSAMGNGNIQGISDIVFVNPDTFDPGRTVEKAIEINWMNMMIEQQHRKYLLIGPGRWGTSDRWLGIPVSWNDISGVGVMVEASIEKLRADPSQGSHFFNNITSLGISYLTISDYAKASEYPDFINWEWLKSLPAENETEYLRHIKLEKPLTIKIDGKKSRAVILK